MRGRVLILRYLQWRLAHTGEPFAPSGFFPLSGEDFFDSKASSAAHSSSFSTSSACLNCNWKKMSAINSKEFLTKSFTCRRFGKTGCCCCSDRLRCRAPRRASQCPPPTGPGPPCGPRGPVCGRLNEDHDRVCGAAAAGVVCWQTAARPRPSVCRWTWWRRGPKRPPRAGAVALDLAALKGRWKLRGGEYY